MELEEQQKKRLDLAVQTRNFEIELFWKRSLFFWGFIAAAFAGYAGLHATNAGLATAIGCFGLVCSFAWSLVTRGSKYWQEGWESKVDECELPLIGRFFAVEMKPQTHKGQWLQSRKFSVSKISIALSDYVFFLWICLITTDLVRHFGGSELQDSSKRWAPLALVISSLIFMLLLIRTGGTSRRPDADTPVKVTTQDAVALPSIEAPSTEVPAIADTSKTTEWKVTA